MSAPITGKSRKLAEKLISRQEAGAQKRISSRKEEIRKNAEGFAASNPITASTVVFGIPILFLLGIVLVYMVISNKETMHLGQVIFLVAIVALIIGIAISFFMDVMMRLTRKNEKRRMQQ